jgi:hypothetical protein
MGHRPPSSIGDQRAAAQQRPDATASALGRTTEAPRGPLRLDRDQLAAIEQALMRDEQCSVTGVRRGRRPQVGIRVGPGLEQMQQFGCSAGGGPDAHNGSLTTPSDDII